VQRDEGAPEREQTSALQRGLWANDEIVVAAGWNQSLYVKRATGSAFEPLPGVPAGNYASVWGFASDDLWFGNQSGQLVHCDGAAWTVVEAETQEKAISNLWGSEGQLFFLTQSEIGRLVGTKPELLIPMDPSEPRITMRDVWGLSPKEVFVSVVDPEFKQYACGETFMLWFDGTEFHDF
jgi:hypothetical protein